MRRRYHRLAALALIALLGLTIAACGGGGSTTGAGGPGPSTDPATARAMAKAEANCRLMLDEVKALAHGVLSEGFKNNMQLVTIGFGRPGLEVARRARSRQQKLIGAIDSKAFETYVGLFDPIILFAQESIEAAKAEDLVTVTNLKEKLTTLGVEQGLVANEAGLPACEIDFLEAMVRAASS
jgi:hypothetical protein